MMDKRVELAPVANVPLIEHVFASVTPPPIWMRTFTPAVAVATMLLGVPTLAALSNKSGMLPLCMIE